MLSKPQTNRIAGAGVSRVGLASLAGRDIPSSLLEKCALLGAISLSFQAAATPPTVLRMISLVPAPTELNKYDLIEEIGHGGMATVFRARDRRLERDVALKLLHRHLRESAEIEARFSSEARAFAKLRHPNIVAVYDVSAEDESERYLVMELVRGVTLRQLLKERGALPVELAAAMVLEIAAALEHAHGEGVIHRDIKPENVLIDLGQAEPRSGEDAEPARIKLTDFGIAKLLDAQGVTSTGQVLGSPAHMAPEQIEGRTVDRRADLFSLGVLFYECIVGKLPFDGKNPAQVLRNVLDGNYDPPVQAKASIGERWNAIIIKALEREPARRHDSIKEFAAQVRYELELVGLDGARHEIARFLDDSDAYCAEFTARIVDGLRSSGIRARQAGDVPLACAQFNRALAYRPSDKELLKHVTGLRRRSQLIRGGAVVGLAAAAVVCVGAVVHFWPSSPQLAKDEDPSSVVQPSAVVGATARSVEPVSAVSPNPDPDLAGPETQPRPKSVRPLPVVKRAPKTTPVAPPEVAEEQPMRRVSVRIRGAAGGSVKIDGTPRPWFGGIEHELPVGEHVFEFVPPNPSCCEATVRRVQIVEGEGVQRVVGEIPFRDARLDMRSGEGEGWSVSCPTLFSGAMGLPGLRRVPMSRVKATGSCVLTNSQQNSATRTKVVTLAAGQTTILAWP